MLKQVLSITALSSALLMAQSPKALSAQEYINIIKKDVTSIDTKKLQSMLKANPNLKIIDVRTRADILKQGGYIKANKYFNISRDKLEFMIGNIVEPNEKFIVSCYSGNISLLATKQLKNMGYKNAIHYKDSYKGWSEAKLENRSLDKYPESMLYSKVQKVADGVYTSIGQMSPSTYENSGHNNNLGFVIGDDAVLVWNAGGNYLLAKALHEEIKKITSKPIKYVVIENSQGHAMLGSNYWKEIGAKIVSHEIAKKEIKEKAEIKMQKGLKKFKDKFMNTKVVLPDITFKDNWKIDLGNKVVEAKYFGYAHEHSDIAIWMPKEKILFAGDLAFNQRMLPIFEITETDKWIEAFDNLAKLNAKIVIPGHGDVTNMPTVTKYTRDYLTYMREEITKILDDDGTLEDAYTIDQSAFEHFDAFEFLALQNASRMFKRMEFE
jgi:glyoxylase-like metal-dependent hydrolase (beta-lactamase superfamily II)/rhodanese-related sulfurtransferase